MSAIRKDQMDNASKFMNEFWKSLVKPYYNPDKNDEFWNETYETMADMSIKYCQDDKRLLHILIGFWTGLELEAKIHGDEL